MNFMKMAAISAAAFGSLSTAAMAATPSVGATVYGPQGEEVGTVEQVGDGLITVNTGKHLVPLPVESFGESAAGPTTTVTKVYLDTLMDEQAALAVAARDALLVEGAEVISANQLPLGTIDSIDGDTVVLKHNDGVVALLREHFVAANSQLMALFTVDQIEATIAANAAN